VTLPIVVTADTMATAFSEARLEQAAEALPGQGDPLERAAFLAGLPRLLEAIRREAATVDPGLLFAPPDPDASFLMSAVAELVPDQSGLEPLTAGGLEVKFATNDWFGWATSIFDWASKKAYHPLPRPGGVLETRIPNSCRIGMVGDWGTGLYGAPVCAATLLGMPRFDLMLHLGDVYYSGTKREVAERFLKDWPFGAAPLHRALNSNHEMASGGYGLFDLTLPRFGQEASYFALGNDHWLLLGLDSGYVDHDVDAKQVAWVEQMVARAAGRRVVLFSHHQLFSHFGKQGERLAEHLGPLLSAGKIAGWYWGHEHRCVVYEPDPRFGGLIARCIGHGGVPEKRDQFATYPVTQSVSGALWRHFPGVAGAPGGQVLDGPNPFIKGHEADYAPHGFATLELAADHLREAIYLPDGTRIYEKEVW
jgi:hypothetical protein